MIIIVTYNGLKWIDKCLESCGNFSVVVVDNNSSDGTVDFIKLNYPKVHLIQQDKNLGFGQANNIGISYALNHGADYAFLLNQDAYLIDNCLEKLIKIQRQNIQFGILSPIHLNGDGTRLDYNFSNYVARNRDFFSDHILNKPLAKVYEVPFVNAAGWLISRKCLETVGGFDPIFYHYGEDENYCSRVNYHKLKVGVVSQTFMLHDREKRKNIEIDNFFYLKERQYKIEFADLSREDVDFQFQNRLKLAKRRKLKAAIGLSIGKYLKLKEEICMLKRIQKEIQASRERNILLGMHYLGLND